MPPVVQEKSSASTRADREIAGSYGPDTVRRTGFVATRGPPARGVEPPGNHAKRETREGGCFAGCCGAYRTSEAPRAPNGDGEPFPSREVVHTHPQKEHHISEPRINERIRVPEVRLVGPNGEQVGIVRVEDALRLAAEADLDLVEVAPMARPPVAKLMDFGKYKYEAALKAREARKNQVNTVIKEIKLRPKIDPHDYGTKKGHVERFLKAGDKVKVTIMFRGREQSRPELGFRLLQRLAEDIVELGYVESSPKQDGRNMVMVLGPTKKKADARAEQRRRRESGAASAAHDEPIDFDDLTHLAHEVTEPEVIEVIEVTEPAEAPAPVEPAAVQPAAVQPAPAQPAVSEPVVSEPVESEPAASTPTAPSTPTPTPAPSAPTPAPRAPAKVTPAKATPAKATTPTPAASAPKPAPAAPATPATPASPTPRPAPRPTPRPAPPAKTTTSAESA